jgi:Cu2+-exporting ATPase
MDRDHEHHPAPDHSTDHDDHAAHLPVRTDVEHAGHDETAGHDQHADHDEHAGHDPHAGRDEHAGHDGHDRHAGRDDHDEHAGHDRHAGHSVEMFRTRFWVCLVLTIPILLYAEGLWDLFGLTAPDLPGGEVVSFVLATAIYVYGGSVFLRSASHEIRARLPGMMTHRLGRYNRRVRV